MGEQRNLGVMSNSGLWDRHFKTDPSKTKQVRKGGRTITAIDAYAQVKEATEEWGPMGKWGMKDVTVITHDVFALMTGTFFYPDGEFELSNSICMYMKAGKPDQYPDADFAKKLITDTITKALSYLGFNADVFFGLFDDNRYVEDRKKEEALSKGKASADLYKKALDLLEKKRKILGEESHSKYGKKLSGIQKDDSRLRVAIGVLEGMTEESKGE